MGISQNVVFALFLCLVAFSPSVFGRPATFLQDFRITWSDSHIRQIEGGKAIQLVLDQNSGNTFHGSPMCFLSSDPNVFLSDFDQMVATFK